MFSQFSSSPSAAAAEHDLQRVSSPFQHPQEYSDSIAVAMDSPYMREYSDSPLTFQTPLNLNRAEYSSSPVLIDYASSQQMVDSFYASTSAPTQHEMAMTAFDVNPSSAATDKDYYPNMLSPPDTPAMHPLRHGTPVGGYQPQQQQSQPWNRSRADSMTWNPEQDMSFQSQHQRAMSLPHISMPQDYQMVQMNFSTSAPSTTSTKSYSRKSSVSSSGSEKTFTCSHPGCERTFSRIQNLRSHMRCHLVTTPHNCKTCGLGFRRTTDLQRHIRTMHVPNDQKPWACSKCPKRFGRSDALKRHMSSRSKDHGCPGGPDLELLRQMEEQKRRKSVKQALQTVVEGTVF